MLLNFIAINQASGVGFFFTARGRAAGAASVGVLASTVLPDEGAFDDLSDAAGEPLGFAVGSFAVVAFALVAFAVGALAAGAFAIGAFAVGALAVGVLAVGALAVGVFAAVGLTDEDGTARGALPIGETAGRGALAPSGRDEPLMVGRGSPPPPIGRDVLPPRERLCVDEPPGTGGRGAPGRIDGAPPRCRLVADGVSDEGLPRLREPGPGDAGGRGTLRSDGELETGAPLPDGAPCSVPEVS